MTLASVAERAREHHPDLRDLSDRTVLGEGPSDATWMIVGEAPGADEDTAGRPFVGRAGRLLTSMMLDAGFDRAEVYITNLVKRRPPENRNPTRVEIAASAAVLNDEIAAVGPLVVTPLGNVPTQHLLGRDVRISDAQGRWFAWQGRWVFPLFHPAFLLRNARMEDGSPRARTAAALRELKGLLEAGAIQPPERE